MTESTIGRNSLFGATRFGRPFDPIASCKVRRGHPQVICGDFSLAAIILMVLLHFRSGVSVILTLLPVSIGSSWLLGFMGVCGIWFNPANIMTLPLVVGIGVTNGIQILNRFAEERSPRLLAKSTGKSVLVSGLTALTGFGTLMLARHQGIRSLGEVMAFGIAACMVASLTFLPALLCLLSHRGWSLTVSHEQPLPHTA